MRSFGRLYRPIHFATTVVVVLGLSFGIVAGQNENSAQQIENGQSRLDQLRARGYEALYNLDYESARQSFTEMARLFPDHPAGPQCLAATLWLEELNRSRQLQASLYSTDSLSNRAEKVDPRKLEMFRSWTRNARSLAEARLRRNPRDVEALYFLGATDGLNAVFTAAVEQKYRAALVDSNRAVDRHKEVLKLDPNLHDAELTIGMSNYIVGSLPFPLKVIARIGGVHGSKKRGLEMLERVAKEGRWARDIARTLLIDLYKREKRWPDALAVTRELAAKYPRNYIFKLQTADVIVAEASNMRRKGLPASAANARVREAYSIFESLLSDRHPANAGARRAADLIHFRYGEVLLAFEEFARAAEEFLSATTQAGGESNLATLARLRAAQALDLSGNRREALAEYQAILKRPDVFRSHENARRGLQSPFRKLAEVR